ncbi:hypothetical protein [Microcoleus sp. LEGE 07076]|nr:hypothetical protein [Microcoleus sp. LEGE 07076]
MRFLDLRFEWEPTNRFWGLKSGYLDLGNVDRPIVQNRNIQ